MTSKVNLRKPYKSPFQRELDEALEKRRSTGHGTGFSDEDDNYDDDFEEDESDDDILKQFTRPNKPLMKTMKGKQDWKIPSYLKDDDDDQSSDDDPSQFLKTTSKPSSSNESKKIGSKSTSPPPKLIKSPRVKDDDPLLSLFNDNLHGESPRTTIDFARGKSDLEYKSVSPPRLTSPNRVRSPASQMTKEDMITSPRSYTKSPPPLSSLNPSSKGSTLPFMPERNPASPPATSPRGSALNRTAPVRQPRKITERQKDDKTVDEILSSMRTSLNEDRDSLDRNNSSKLEKDRTSLKENRDPAAFKSQSIIDFILDDPKPKPAPRRREPEEEKRSRSRSGSRPGTPGSSRHRSPTPPSVVEKKRINSDVEKRTKSPPQIQGHHGPFPPLSNSIMTSSTEGRARDKRRSRKIKESEVDTMVQRDNDTAQEKTSTTDELLALFEQVNTVDDVNRERKVSPVQPVLEDRVKSPVEEVVDKTINEMSMDDPKQRTSQQLIDNVISNVATHNENTIHQQGYEQSQKDIKESSEKKKSKEKRPGSSLRMSHKSYRTPPVGYQGLGSTTGLKSLKTYQGKSEDQSLNSSADIRQSIYMQWLAEREVKLKENKKQEKLKKKEEEEKKKKEIEEKKLEGESARRAWLEHKEELIKENEKRKRREQRKEREKKLEKEEEKWKSEKKGDIIRKKKLEEARKKHREEEKRKREEELLKEEKERKKKEENEKAMKEWTEKRSESWVKEKKKEKKEKSKIESKKREEKDKKTEEAQDKYKEWREKKEETMKRNRRRVVEEEDRPMWKPANKVIPFGR